MPTIPIMAASLPRKGLLSFGFQRAPTSGHPNGHRHNGIDLPAPVGTTVHAARAGLVRFATSEWRQGFTGYGNVVVISHDDGTSALYAHLQRALVEAGEPVDEGQAIGEVGTSQYNAPEHTSHFDTRGAHLHFEVSATPYPQESTAPRLDPVTWLAEGNRIAADPLGPTEKTPVRGSRSLHARRSRSGSSSGGSKNDT